MRMLIALLLLLGLSPAAGAAVDSSRAGAATDPSPAPPASPDTARSIRITTSPDTLRFELPRDETARSEPRSGARPRVRRPRPDAWLQPPYGDGLLTDLDAWRSRARAGHRARVLA